MFLSRVCIMKNHCRETSIKVRGTLDKKREKGQFIGAFAPYGYLKDPEDYHHLVVNPETAPRRQRHFPLVHGGDVKISNHKRTD